METEIQIFIQTISNKSWMEFLCVLDLEHSVNPLGSSRPVGLLDFIVWTLTFNKYKPKQNKNKMKNDERTLKSRVIRKASILQQKSGARASQLRGIPGAQELDAPSEVSCSARQGKPFD